MTECGGEDKKSEEEKRGEKKEEKKKRDTRKRKRIDTFRGCPGPQGIFGISGVRGKATSPILHIATVEDL